MASELEPVATKDEAMQRADQIRTGLTTFFTETMPLIADAFHRRDWVALDYKSWDDYVKGEFGSDQLRLSRSGRQHAVELLRQDGLSVRAIASAIGASKNTVKADLDEVGQTDPPAQVTGSDGKVYTPTDLWRKVDTDEPVAVNAPEWTTEDRQRAEAVTDNGIRPAEDVASLPITTTDPTTGKQTPIGQSSAKIDAIRATIGAGNTRFVTESQPDTHLMTLDAAVLKDPKRLAAWLQHDVEPHILADAVDRLDFGLLLPVERVFEVTLARAAHYLDRATRQVPEGGAEGDGAVIVRQIRDYAGSIPLRRGRKAKPADESTEDTDQT
jgi:hypothetical protein